MGVQQFFTAEGTSGGVTHREVFHADGASEVAGRSDQEHVLSQQVLLQHPFQGAQHRLVAGQLWRHGTNTSDGRRLQMGHDECGLTGHDRCELTGHDG